MTNYELAINEEGEPFAVPPEVYGWRVRRSSDGRGRPALVHARGKGKPLIVPVDASHADLLAAAGPGRYDTGSRPSTRSSIGSTASRPRAPAHLPPMAPQETMSRERSPRQQRRTSKPS